jgi:hypothetical protein
VSVEGHVAYVRRKTHPGSDLQTRPEEVENRISIRGVTKLLDVLDCDHLQVHSRFRSSIAIRAHCNGGNLLGLGYRSWHESGPFKSDQNTEILVWHVFDKVPYIYDEL